ncbi:hypothetical protein WR25_16449 isoform A [Diploscapter pachys]|uniref:Aftiphilin clathrin-binding box domain-containing protein n=2 Tax=Diploscapter pachys TaxID=2018661 RepID=A0A2A2L1E3_9BILA|nr:hypothetical protein WR25_16449 isoform A [Diploscapter pachys]
MDDDGPPPLTEVADDDSDHEEWSHRHNGRRLDDENDSDDNRWSPPVNLPPPEQHVIDVPKMPVSKPEPVPEPVPKPVEPVLKSEPLQVSDPTPVKVEEEPMKTDSTQDDSSILEVPSEIGPEKSEAEEDVPRTAPESVPEISAEDDDIWDDFAGVSYSESKQETREEPEKVDEAKMDDWNAFEGASGSDNQSEDQGDDWATDWVSAPAPISRQPSEVSETKNEPESALSENIEPDPLYPRFEDLCDDEGIWEDFEVNSDEADSPREEFEEQGVLSIVDLFDSDSDLCSSNHLLRVKSIWTVLRVMAEANALQFNWKTSLARVHTLDALKVDEKLCNKPQQNSLSSTVLLPTPITLKTTPNSSSASRSSPSVSAVSTSSASASVSASESLSTDVMSPSTSSEMPSDVSTATSRSMPKAVMSISGSSNVSTPESSGIICASASNGEITSLSVPPAEFDWEHSGLKNPLKGASQSSSLLDIDFLSANSGSAAATNTLQKELDELGLNTVSEFTQFKSDNSPSVLDEILSKAQENGRKTYKPPAELSLDVRALHDQLPDISYLKSKIVMFPFGREVYGSSAGQNGTQNAKSTLDKFGAP